MSTLPVIAAVDGSDDSLRALDWALDAARRRGAPLRVVHVRQYAVWAQPDVLVAGAPDADDDPVLDRVRTHLEERPDRTDGPDRPGPPRTEYLGVEGAPGAVLPELGSGAQLLVLGSRGRGGFASLLLGSNGMAAARDAECPVVVVPRPGRQADGAAPAGPGPRVVVGLHVDSPDDAALDFAYTEAGLRGVRLQVIAAYQWPLQGWATPGEVIPPKVDQDAVENETRALAEGFLAPHSARHRGVVAEPHVLPGDAAGHLVAASQGADLVVVGRHRRRLLAPARMMGSVTQAVLLHAASPVAVVPPGAVEPQDLPED
ncbi:universal stress protein [Streptomyces sp. NPDC093990]|uniref:universal stress protein n=1 Tax=Streptomyces sp. NPDC093990 TaxID=3155306 RepID=UPI003440B9CB